VKRLTKLGTIIIIVTSLVLAKTYFSFELDLLSAAVESQVGKTLESISEPKTDADMSKSGDAGQGKEAKPRSAKAIINDIKGPSDIVAEVEKKKEVRADAKSIIERYSGELLSLEAGFVARINGIYSGAVAEYSSLPASERSKKKYDIARRCIGAGKALEARADGQFYGLMDRLARDLENSGNDTSIVNDFKVAYASQKRAFERSMMSTIIK
jgi:hypothetical protein